ncbi:Fluoroacetate dehalogenase [Lecanosticta acicola]|uniref:Fluoroacetate dehalogenase n=1 Tax=Lecanosticta acicola TaxID=111012 RepID=A0AAI9E9V8_9PEZI|nr:Fluoroacetate dehalogenase [Lecanosticta acicola]
MADQSLKTLHPFLQQNDTKVSSGGTVKSFTHDTGSGPVLCVVHGWPQSSYMWRHVLADWKSMISLFVVELPGYGFSSLPPKSDKRTVGNLIMEALQHVFSKSRPVIWCGHDRGGRIGHRLLVDNDASHNIRAAILMDIVPTTEQWKVFANPLASMAYYHWPFLAIPTAPLLIEGMGGGEFARINLGRAKGANTAGAAKFRENDALDHYAHQFSNPECISGSCADYAAGATDDVQEQEKDQKEGRKVATPTLIIYSASNLGRMHDVPKTWSNWIEGEVRYEGVPDGFGHYLPEECPERITPLVLEWIAKYKD